MMVEDRMVPRIYERDNFDLAALVLRFAHKFHIAFIARRLPILTS